MPAPYVMNGVSVELSWSRRGLRRLRELWAARELLRNLVSMDLKVRYKNSAFGFAWSMTTPLAMMVIFTIVFTRVFRAPIPDFPIYFLVGFLAWQYFSASVMGGVGSIVGNANLIKKVYFPREVLPLAHVFAQGVHFLLALLVLFGFLLYRGENFLPFLPLLLVTIAIQTILNAGLTMIFAAANVPFRDVQELAQVVFLIWFYATPIFYSPEMAPPTYRTILQLNPMTIIVTLYRHALYALTWPSLHFILAATAVSVVVFIVGYVAFSRLAVTFAKEV